MDLENQQKSRKNRKRKRRQDVERASQPPVNTQSPTFEADEDGLPVDEYARRLGLAVPDVWQKVRAGELIGRTSRGRLIIYGSAEQAKSFAKQAEEQTHVDLAGPGIDSDSLPYMATTFDPSALQGLPPLPPVVTGGDVDPSGGFLSLSGQRSESPEIALLLDHLSLAKEENREILKMTQQSIRKVTELSDHIVEMKDAVIDAKEEKIRALEEQLASRQKDILKLQESNEDLETLNRTILSQK